MSVALKSTAKDLEAFGARSPEKVAQLQRLLTEAQKHPVKRSSAA